ncbi:MAG: hypothetical protein IT548_00350 [Alphaproteobacteria bacterium]|nr:hypothetical protein [Alphaproteobacteria bacterium]
MLAHVLRRESLQVLVAETGEGFSGENANGEVCEWELADKLDPVTLRHEAALRGRNCVSISRKEVAQGETAELA